MPSQTNVSTEVLRELHRIHRQLTDLRERLQRGPKQVQIREANVAHQEEQLAHARTETRAFRMATDSKQLQFKSKEQRVKELRVKLNAASSNREYQALKDQIAADEMANSVLADEILEALERIDVLQKKVGEAEKAVARAKQEAQKIRQEVEANEPLIRADLQRLESQLRQSEASLPEEIREAYLRVVRQKGEDALAPVADEYCGGCHQHVPLNLCSAMILNRPIFCKCCGRLLYIPEARQPA